MLPDPWCQVARFMDPRIGIEFGSGSAEIHLGFASYKSWFARVLKCQHSTIKLILLNTCSMTNASWKRYLYV